MIILASTCNFRCSMYVSKTEIITREQAEKIALTNLSIIRNKINIMSNNELSRWINTNSQFPSNHYVIRNSE